MTGRIGDVRLPERAVRWLGVVIVVAGLAFPFTVIAIRAKRWQPPPVEKSVVLRPELVVLPEGRFLMGSPDDEPGHDEDEALHEVELTVPFAVARTEVTQGQYAAVMEGSRPVEENDCAEAGVGDDLPVVCVTWRDAVDYANALSALEGLEAAYAMQGDDVTWNPDARGYRLLTEAEWAYAARAGTRTRFVGTDVESEACTFANVADRALLEAQPDWRFGSFDCNDTSSALAPVDDREPNRWLLFGFGGNAGEWVWDAYEKDLTRLGAKDPSVPGGGYRVFRGGSWRFVPQFARVAFRFRAPPAIRYDFLGFRVARSPFPSELLPSVPLPTPEAVEPPAGGAP